MSGYRYGRFDDGPQARDVQIDAAVAVLQPLAAQGRDQVLARHHPPRLTGQGQQQAHGGDAAVEGCPL